MRILVFVAFIALCSCATDFEAEQEERNEAVLARADARVGMDINQLIAELGYPTAERTIAGRRLYSWTRMAGSTLDRLQCTLTYEVGADGKSVQYEMSGNAGACAF